MNQRFLGARWVLMLAIATAAAFLAFTPPLIRADALAAAKTETILTGGREQEALK